MTHQLCESTTVANINHIKLGMEDILAYMQTKLIAQNPEAKVASGLIQACPQCKKLHVAGIKIITLNGTKELVLYSSIFPHFACLECTPIKSCQLGDYCCWVNGTCTHKT